MSLIAWRKLGVGTEDPTYAFSAPTAARYASPHDASPRPATAEDSFMWINGLLFIRKLYCLRIFGVVAILIAWRNLGVAAENCGPSQGRNTPPTAAPRRPQPLFRIGLPESKAYQVSNGYIIEVCPVLWRVLSRGVIWVYLALNITGCPRPAAAKRSEHASC